MEAKRLGEIAPAIGSPEQLQPTRPMLDRKIVAELWRRMAAIYAHKWVSGYGECDADDTWAIGLVGLTGQQIANGLRACIDVAKDRVRVGDEDWPPTLGEFRARCEYVYQYASNTKALPKTAPATREEALAHLEACKRALGEDLPWTYPLNQDREPGEDG